MSQLKTLQEAANTAPGAFISGGFQANVSKVLALQGKKTGKTFWKCTLSEGGLEVTATSFNRDLFPLEGHLVKFTGMGLKRGENYNDKAQISLGDKTIISPVGDSQPYTPSEAVKSPVIAQNGGSGRIEGVTVGMAINKAVDICIKTGDVSEEAIWHRSSTLIRLAQKLQAGNLAPELVSVETSDEEQPY